MDVKTKTTIPPLVFESHADDLNTMCLPHKIDTLDKARIINTARWAQREIERLEKFVGLQP